MSPAPRKPSVRPFQGLIDSIDDPLEFLRSETYRQRQAGAALERLAEGVSRADEILSVCEFLSVDLPLHLLDAKADLAVLLREACKPRDNIESVVEELSALQKTLSAQGKRTTSALLKHLERGPSKGPTQGARRLAKEMASTLRRLSALENGILIPLARVRLKEDELSELARRMRIRRGLGAAKS